MPPPLNFQLEKTFGRYPPRPGGTLKFREANAMATVRLQVLQGVAGSGAMSTTSGTRTETRGQASRGWGPTGARGPSDSARRGCTVAGARETLLARGPPVPGSPRSHNPFSEPPDRPAEAPAAAARGPNRRLTPHGAAQQPLRGNGREPETPLEGPRKALGSRSQVAAPTAAAAAATAAALTRDGKVAGST